MESELGWMRYYSCNIGCLINSKNESGFLKTGASSGFLRVSSAALRITPRRQDELWCWAAGSRRKKCSYVLIFVHPKLKNDLLCEPIIQIKFRLHRYVSYDKIFKTRPHLIIFILYFF